jgi:deazaflavin-dependent oxidoreductase (nitroreductase family)
MAHYQKPPYILSKVANPVMNFMVRTFGLKKTGVEVLTVKGRKSGTPISVPVNPLDFEGKRYLVCPRGESDWVRNLRAAKSATLQTKGRKSMVVASEVADTDKAPILKEYLRRWEKAAGSYFGLGADAELAQFAEIAPKHPVFEIVPMKIA